MRNGLPVEANSIILPFPPKIEMPRVSISVTVDRWHDRSYESYEVRHCGE
jgi:hypothetical protein